MRERERRRERRRGERERERGKGGFEKNKRFFFEVWVFTHKIMRECEDSSFPSFVSVVVFDHSLR